MSREQPARNRWNIEIFWEIRRKVQKNEGVDCAIGGRTGTFCKDRAGHALPSDCSTNERSAFIAVPLPFRLDEDRIGGSAISLGVTFGSRPGVGGSNPVNTWFLYFAFYSRRADSGVEHDVPTGHPSPLAVSPCQIMIRYRPAQRRYTAASSRTHPFCSTVRPTSPSPDARRWRSYLTRRVMRGWMLQRRER